VRDAIFTSLQNGKVPPPVVTPPVVPPSPSSGGGTGGGGFGGGGGGELHAASEIGGGGFGGRLVRHIVIQEIVKINSETNPLKPQLETAYTQGQPQEHPAPENNCCPVNHLGPNANLFNTLLLWIIVAVIIVAGISSAYILKSRQLTRRNSIS